MVVDRSQNDVQRCANKKLEVNSHKLSASEAIAQQELEPQVLILWMVLIWY